MPQHVGPLACSPPPVATYSIRIRHQVAAQRADIVAEPPAAAGSGSCTLHCACRGQCGGAPRAEQPRPLRESPPQGPRGRPAACPLPPCGPPRFFRGCRQTRNAQRRLLATRSGLRPAARARAFGAPPDSAPPAGRHAMESRRADARRLSCALPRPSRPGAAASWRRAGAQGSAGGPAPRRPGMRATAGRPRRPSPSRFPPCLPHFARMHSADPCPAARPLRPLHNALAGPRMRRDECHARCRRACSHSPRPGQPPRPCRLRHARAPSARRRARGSGPRRTYTAFATGGGFHCPAPSPRERTAAPQARAALLLSPCTAPPARRGPAGLHAPARPGPPVPRKAGAPVRGQGGDRLEGRGGRRGPVEPAAREPPRRALRRGPIGLGRQSQCFYSQQIPPPA